MTSNCEIKQQTAIDEWIRNVNLDDPYVNSVYYDQIQPLFSQYQATLTGDFQRQRDQTLLNQVTADINRFFANEIITNVNFPTLYPDLYERITTLPVITPAEVERVFDDTLISLDVVNDYLIPYNPTIPTAFNDYYSPGSFSKSGMQSFCSLIPNIFSAFNNLINAFNDIKAFANRFNNILSAIQEFSLAGLLENLKKQALAVIDQIVAKIKAKIAAFKSLFNRIMNFRINLDNVFAKMQREKERIESVIADEPIEKLKKAVEGAISFAASLFEELKIEEIQFLLLRFCELISGIENFFDDLVRPIQDIPDNFRRSFDFLRAAGFAPTARALAAGAFRLDADQRQAGANGVAAVPGQGDAGAPGAPPGQGFGDEGLEIDGGLAVRRRRYLISPITDEESEIVSNDMSYERVKSGASQHAFLITNNRSHAIDGRKVWDNVRPLEKVMLYRLSRLAGKKLTVTSAYRSKRAQQEINPRVPTSWHSSGQAFDVVVSSFGAPMNQIKLWANTVGFGFVKEYPGQNFIHISAGG